MKKIAEMYLERVFDDMKREDMNVIKHNLKRLVRPDLAETLLVNTIDNVWISADSIFELIKSTMKDRFEKVFKVINVESYDRDKVVKEYCFKVEIDDFGELVIAIEGSIEGLAWTSEEYINYMIEKNYMRYSENKKSERYNIPFRYERQFKQVFNLNDIRNYILKSE